MRAKKPRDLASLLKLLREHGVTHFKDGPLELTLQPGQRPSVERAEERAYLEQMRARNAQSPAKLHRSAPPERFSAAPTQAAQVAAQLGASPYELAEVQALFPQG